MSATYSRLGYAAIKFESVPGTAVKPNNFVPIMSEDIVPKYDVSVSSPVAANPVINLRGVPNAIKEPTGKITINIEPESIGFFLKGSYGTPVDGIFLPASSIVGTFQVGETITGGSSAATAAVNAISSEGDYILTGTWTGTFTVGETVTGGTSSATATVGNAIYTAVAATVYGHQFVNPATALPAATVEFGYADNAVRLFGVVFNDFMTNQKNNIIMGEATITAKAAFTEARITAITASGAGSKVLTVDQTSGLVVGDVMKIYRPSTGQFIDFNGATVKTNTVTAIGSENSITFTVLTTTTAVGDLLLLAPQIPTYVDKQPFSWVGGSTSKIADSTLTAAMAASAGFVEDFEIGATRGIESRHAANGANIINRFPSALFQKGIKGNGKLHQIFTDMVFLDRLRNNRQVAMQLYHNAGIIGSTGIPYTLDWRIPEFILDAFNPTIKEDAMLDQEMPFTLFYNQANGYFIKAFLINDIASY